MNKLKLGYVAATALFCLGTLPGAVMDIVQPSMIVDMMHAIDMPLYILTLVGVWKLLGVVALALPRLGRLNEWAYAGFFFDLTGAAWCHTMGGDTAASVVTPLVFLIPLGASYLLREVSAGTAGVVGAVGVGAAA
ncbi:MAG: DoxX family protein [Alphaproteobacteria bacterium]|nr:DoxX family protein [Alphaproteobacteria bacterium]